jgi:hypothetical protein
VPVAAVASAEQALRHAGCLTSCWLTTTAGLDGLALCWDAKWRDDPPTVLIYSAFARPRLAVAATLADADAILDKGAQRSSF